MFELLLALAIVVLVAGVFTLSLLALSDSSELEHGSAQLQTTLRMARAEAAAGGRRVRLAFIEEPEAFGSCVTVERENDPIGAPGQFETWDGCPWADHLPGSKVRITSARLTGDSALAGSDAQDVGGFEDDESLASITFYPDGSSDSAEIELAPRDPDDPRRMIVSLAGWSGALSARLVRLEEGESGRSSP